MEKNEEKTIYQKVFEAKKEFTAISKDQNNPHFKSAYYDINDLLKMVDPVLHNHGLMVLQPIKDGNISTLIIDVETGEKIEASYQLEHNPNPQKVGSEITYYRRYLLSSLLSLQAEDDDGNKASEKRAQSLSSGGNTPPMYDKWLNQFFKGTDNETPEWKSIIKGIDEGKITSVTDARKYYKVNKEVAESLQTIIDLKG